MPLPDTPWQTWTYVGGADAAPDGVTTLGWRCSVDHNEHVGNATTFLRARRTAGLVVFNLMFWTGTTTTFGTSGGGPFTLQLPTLFSTSQNQIFTGSSAIGSGVAGTVGPILSPTTGGSAVINSTGTNWGAGGALYLGQTLLPVFSGGNMTPTSPINLASNAGTMLVASGCLEAFGG